MGFLEEIMEESVNIHFKDFEATDKYIKPFMYLKGFAVGRKLPMTLIALSISRVAHMKQRRKDKITPYLTHPLYVTNLLVMMGVDDDVVLAASLLHDVLEDTEITKEELLTYEIGEEVLYLVELLTKESGLNDDQLTKYFNEIKKDERAALIKCSDRVHNCSTLENFKREKILSYIDETEKYVLPLTSYCMSFYPRYTSLFSLFKCILSDQTTSMKAMLNKNTENPNDE